MRVFQSIFDRYPSETMDYIVRLFLLVGGWPLRADEKNIYLRLIRIMPYFGLVCCFINALLMGYNISISLGDVLLLSQHATVIVILMKSVLRLMIGAFKNPFLVETVRRLNGFTRCYQDETERKIFERYKRRARWFTVVYSYSCFILNLVFTLEPLFEKDRLFPNHFEFPLPNALDSPQYEILYFATIGMGLIFSGAITAGDLFFVSTLTYLSCNYKILQHKLESCREFAVKDVLAKEAPKNDTFLRGAVVDIRDSIPDESHAVPMDTLKDDLDGKSTGERFKVGITHQSNVITTVPSMKSNEISTSNIQHGVDRMVNNRRRTPRNIDKTSRRLHRDAGLTRKVFLAGVRTPVALTTTCQRRVTRVKQDNSAAFNVAMEKHLDECVKYQQDLMSFADQIHKEDNQMLFFEIVVGAFLTCINLFQLSQVPFLSIKYALRFSYLLLNVGQIFVFCSAASELSAESALVGDAVYFSDWLEASRSFKVKMRIIMSRSLKPIVVTAASFLPFNLEVFTNMMNSAYSYYNIALTMHGKK